MKCIYGIRNVDSGKIYVGSTKNFKSRKYEHCNSLKNNKHHSAHLQNSWNKYGAESFEFIIIEEITDLDKLLEREIYWIEYYNSINNEWGYNMAIPTLIGGHICTERKKAILRVKVKQQHQRQTQEGYYRTVLYNLKTDTYTVYNTPKEAKLAGSIGAGKMHNLNVGTVIIRESKFSDAVVAKWKKRYDTYIYTPPSTSVFAVSAYDFTIVKEYKSKTQTAIDLFGVPNEVNQITQVIDTTNRFRWYYYFSSKEKMNELLLKCHKVMSRENYTKPYSRIEKTYKYKLVSPDKLEIHLYQAKDCVNYIPNATTKGVKKLVSNERSSYYGWTIEKLNGSTKT